MSCYRNVYYRNVLLPKCLLPKCPVTEMSITKVSFTKMSWIRGIHRHSSTEDNATSFSKPDTVLNVAYLNKPSVDPAANRTKAVAVVANTEATKSQHRSLPNIDQTDSTSDDVPQRPTTKEESAMLHEVHPKRSTTPIPLVARMTRNDFSGSADDRKKLNLRSINHGCTPVAESRTDKVTCSMTSFQNPQRLLMALSWCQHELQIMMLQPAQWRHLVRQKLRRCGRLVRLYVHEMAVLCH